MAHRNDPFAAAIHTTHAWLNAVADELGTEDRQFAFRTLRAWMHAVRDRIGVSNSAHVSAQLPELLRGVWYEGWVPARVPVRHGVAAFIDQFAEQARIDRREVVPTAGKVTRALDQLFAPGQLSRVFAVLPGPLGIALWGDFLGAGHETDHVSRSPSRRLAHGRDHDLAHQLRVLGEAVAVLARGLEQLPALPPDEQRAAAAGQSAHRILLAEGLVEQSTTDVS
ncbi:DUF2267 domain-containing protein [Nocardia carnea]|uniref:DUF2267 domain-containing protein n=1 Tax=Nocardia carnea TaxID=37328 RepID=A0ABW7TJZ1_9NOCA|nr:DUF2267 domain-containing protein [Nocardia carnea]